MEYENSNIYVQIKNKVLRLFVLYAESSPSAEVGIVGAWAFFGRELHLILTNKPFDKIFSYTPSWMDYSLKTMKLFFYHFFEHHFDGTKRQTGPEMETSYFRGSKTHQNPSMPRNRLIHSFQIPFTGYEKLLKDAGSWNQRPTASQ